MADDGKSNTPSQIARAIAIANGHPNPDDYVARFDEALASEPAPAPAPAEAPAAPAQEG